MQIATISRGRLPVVITIVMALKMCMRLLSTTTGTQTTEVHVLDGRTSFKTFLVHTGTALHLTGTDGAWDFDLGDYNRDGMLDLFAIYKHNTGTRTTEVHVLNGADQFQTFLLQHWFSFTPDRQ